MIQGSCEDEMDCGAVFENLDRYADFILRSGERTEIIGRIEEHLALCDDCAEEFALLLKALEKAEGTD